MTDTSNRSRVQAGVPTGGEFATEAKGENPDLAVVLPQPDFDPDTRAYLVDMKGAFVEGYTEDETADFSAAMSGAAEMICVWDGREDGDFTGGSMFYGRLGDDEPWRPISSEAWSYLHEKDDHPFPEHFLSDTTEDLDLDAMFSNDSGNFAPHSEDEDEGEEELPWAYPTNREWDHLGKFEGKFKEGYKPKDIRDLAKGMDNVEIACVWNKHDQDGFGGDSEIIGRLPGGEWRSLSPEFTDFLDGNGDLTTPKNLLADTAHPAYGGSLMGMPTDDHNYFDDPTKTVELAGRRFAPGEMVNCYLCDGSGSTRNFTTCADCGGTGQVSAARRKKQVDAHT